MVFIRKWSVTLLLMLFVCMAYAPTMAAISCFFLGLAVQIHQPAVFKFAKNDMYKLLVALVGLLLIGILFSIDLSQSLKALGRMLPVALAVYGALHVLRSRITSVHQTTVIPENPQQGYDYTLRNPIQLLSLTMIIYVVVIYLCLFLFDVSQLHHWAISHQNKLTTLMLMLVCVQSAVWVAHQRFWHVFLAILLCLSALLIEGRGAFFTGMLVLSVALMLRYRLFEKRYLLLVSLGVLAASGILCLLLLIQMRGGFAHFSLNGFLSGRIELWQAAVDVILHKPWFGIGFGTWQKSEWVNSLIPVFKNQPSPHNIVLDLLSSVGVIGALFFVGMVKFYIDYIRKIPFNLSPLYRCIGFLTLGATVMNGLIDFRLFATQFLGISAIALILWQGGRDQTLSVERMTSLK
jgi:O-Antigen ligase